MAKAAYISQPTILRIPALLEEVRDGALRVPRFQRPPVWTDEQRIALLRSIREGIPIGSLLVWRTNAHPDLATYPLGPHREDNFKDSSRQYLLDGHQRVTSLFTSLGWGLLPADERPTREERAQNEYYGEIAPIHYNLRKQTFENSRPGRPLQKWHIPLDELFDDYALYELNKELGELEDGRALINRARNLHKTFYDYQIAIVPISTDSLEVAVSSFERANTESTQMSEAHMVSALVYSSGYDVNSALADIQQDLEAWSELDGKVILAVCKAQLDFDLFSKQTLDLIKAIKSDKKLLIRAGEAVALATSFLRDCAIHGPGTLPYTHQLVLLADVLARQSSPDDRELRDRLKRWLWVTTYIEHFASVSSTRLRATLQHLREFAVSGDDEAMLPARYSNLEVLPPKRFDFRAARSRALALMMAGELDPEQTGDPQRLLAALGRRAMPKLLAVRDLREHDTDDAVDPSEGFENRFIAELQHTNEVRRRIREARPDDADFLRRHGVDEQTAAHLRDGNYHAFLRARRAFFIAKEKQFVESLGLRYTDDGA